MLDNVNKVSTLNKNMNELCSLLVQKFYSSLLFRFLLNVPVNNFSVMSGRSHRFLGYYQYFWEVNVSFSRTHHGDLSENRTPTPRSGVRRSTTRPPRLPVISFMTNAIIAYARS